MVGFGDSPEWSPDGTRIAYSSAPGRDVHVVGADGSGDVAVTTDPGSEDFNPAWAPDGETLVRSPE